MEEKEVLKKARNFYASLNNYRGKIYNNDAKWRLVSDLLIQVNNFIIDELEEKLREG